MSVVRTRVAYTSNVKGLQADIDRKLLRIVKAATIDGAAHIRATSPVSARAGEATLTTTGRSITGGIVSCAAVYPANQFWGIMLDKGTLGKRKLPVKYPNKRKSTWQGKRRAARPKGSTAGGYTTSDRVSIKRPKGGGTTVTFHRHPETLARGGKAPEYFFVRGKRVAERTLAKRLLNGL